MTIQRDNEQLVSASLGQLSSPPAKAVELHWQQQLEAAQNVLFCKELFSQLAREAVSLQAPIPHMVVGSQITASLFPDIQLIISLCPSPPHSAGKMIRTLKKKFRRKNLIFLRILWIQKHLK